MFSKQHLVTWPASVMVTMQFLSNGLLLENLCSKQWVIIDRNLQVMHG